MARKPRSSKSAGKVVEARVEAAPPIPAPVRLGEILGQDRAVSLIDAALRSGRLHHAWIFHGPSGVGKFTTALAFAAVALDPTSAPGPDGRIEPDPASPTQTRLRAGSHPDLHVINKELAVFSREDRVRSQKQRVIPVEIVREFLIEPATLTGSARDARASKVFIVDEAELLADTGQNALLKTLEEPAPGTIVMLVTSSEDRLLPTIRSRCQRVPFGPLPDVAMNAWLDSSGLDVPVTARGVLLEMTCGSPGLALTAVTTGLLDWHSALSPLLSEIDRGRMPIALGATIEGLLKEWSEGWVAQRKNASKEAANKAASGHMVRMLAEHFRRGLRADHAAARRGAAAIHLLNEAERQLDANVHPTFVFDNWAAQVCAQ